MTLIEDPVFLSKSLNPTQSNIRRESLPLPPYTQKTCAACSVPGKSKPQPLLLESVIDFTLSNA